MAIRFLPEIRESGGDPGATGGLPASAPSGPGHWRASRQWHPVIGLGIALGLALICGLAAAEPPKPRAWDFEADRPGAIAAGFVAAEGRWEVVADGANRVLAQRASNPDDTFNVALAAGTDYGDLDLSVKLKAVAGELDRGGGLVWRAKDARNYYIARYNPLEDNFRVYKVEDGKRTQFESANVPGDAAWHTLRVTMVGDRIRCLLDGKALLDVADGTFPGAGKVGLWSKSDARTYFDDLSVAAP